MRRLVIGLVVVSLLAFAGTASAQVLGGHGDPLGLISGGAISPFWGAGANVTVFEITSPVGTNTQGHAIFFTDACTRDESVPIPVTTNGVLVFPTSHPAANITFNGLVAIAATLDQVSLVPLQNPIHVRAHWINVASDFVRVLDPLGVVHAENLALAYQPLRSGASFAAGQDGGSEVATIYLVCPNSAVLGLFTGGAWSGLPAPPPTAFSTNSNLISGRVYDWEEHPIRNLDVNCRCLSTHTLASISPIYALTATYTELVTYPGVTPPGSPNTFTGYRAIVAGPLDDFGRLNNAAARSYAGSTGGPTDR